MAERAKGIQVHRPIVYGSVARLLTPSERALCKDPNHTHTWTVFVRSAASPAPDAKASSSAVGGRAATASSDDELLPGGADDMSYFLKRVSFRLHDSFPTPLRNIDKPPYQVTETGWGEFPLQIRLTFVPEAAEKPVHIVHNLKLHHWLPAVVPAAQEEEEGPMEVDGDKEAVGVNGPEAGQGPGGEAVKADPVVIDPSTNTAVPPASSSAADPPPAATSTDPAAPSQIAGLPAAAPGTTAVPVDTTALVDRTSVAAQTAVVGSSPAAAAAAPPPRAVPPSGPVNSYQYDELVFTNPTLPFLALLQAHPPTPLPVQPRVKGRFEYTLGLERAEGERIEEGRREVVREMEGWRRRLIESEREVARLREQVGDL